MTSPKTPDIATDIENQPILISSVSRGEGEEGYETMFLRAADEGGEYEIVYFRRLDDEFNKVVKFYRVKVEEVMKEVVMLNKQMEALIAFRIKVEGGESWIVDRSVEMTRLASGVAASAAALVATTPSGPRTAEELPWITQEAKELEGSRPTPLEILSHVKMNNNPETPCSTIKSFLSVHDSNEIKFNRENPKKPQKYDEITSRNASKAYLKMVDNSYLGSSDESHLMNQAELEGGWRVTKVMERVEATFIKHFANSNRRKGLNILRPRAKRERHRVTFTLGLFGFIGLHMLMYAANIYFWKKYRVNYPFIFGFKEGTELGCKDVLLLSFGVVVFAIAGALANLAMEMDPKTQRFEEFTELVPQALLGVTLHDFFLADQLTSQVQGFRSLEFYICYYGWGDYKNRETTCQTNNLYKTLYFIIAAIPYWSRFLQL
ncbi:unnamed protein product [Camellia sinensis]